MTDPLLEKKNPKKPINPMKRYIQKKKKNLPKKDMTKLKTLKYQKNLMRGNQFSKQ